MVAIVVLFAEGEENGEAGAAPERRLDLDSPTVRRHYALRDGEAEAGAGGLSRIEGLENPAPLLGGHSAARIADGDADLSRTEADPDSLLSTSLQLLYALPGHISHH